MPVDRSRLPALGPEPTFEFPDVVRRALPSGLRVWTIEHREMPIVSVLLLLPTGAAADPGERPGLAATAGDLLDEGCGDLSALDLHEALGRLGAHIDTEVGADATVLTLLTLERFADRGLELLADMTIRPRFERREFDRVRDLRVSRLVQLRDVPSAVADRVFAEHLYGSHPYGHASIGTEESLKAMTVEEVRRFHAAQYLPSRATIIAIGDAPHDRLFALVEQAFGGWTGRASDDRPVSVASVLPTATGRLALVHRPGSAQSELRIGHVSVPRSTPDYHALLTLNMVLGGQFVSRLNMKLREEKGYTYGARSSFDFRRGPGPFLVQASVQSEATTDAVREALSEIGAIRGDRPVTREELILGRAALTRGYPRNFETSEQVGRAAAQMALYELPDDYFTTFVPRVLSLTEDDLTRAAMTHIDPGKLLTVIVGDREKVDPTIGELGLGEPIEVLQVANSPL